LVPGLSALQHPYHYAFPPFSKTKFPRSVETSKN
jgi:hypothetical protein